jgi:hypothetical protein
VRVVVDLVAGGEGAVIATGVESVADATALLEAGVRMGQGWLFGRARPGFPPPAAGDQVRAAWAEHVRTTRVAGLVQPTGGPVDAAGGAWRAEVDDEGRLRAVIAVASGERIEASRVLKVRATLDLTAAARRVLDAGDARRPAGLAAVVTEDGRLTGLVDTSTLLRAALAGGLRD